MAFAPSGGCSCPPPCLGSRLPGRKASARLGPGKMVSHCHCPPPSEPPSLPARERRLAHLHAGRVGLPDFSSPAHESGFPLLCRQASFGLEVRLGGGRPPEPRRQSSEPLLWGRAWPPDSSPACQPRDPQGRPSPRTGGGGEMLSAGSSGPALNRWGEAVSPAVEQLASHLHPPKPTLPTEHAQLICWNYKC